MMKLMNTLFGMVLLMLTSTVDAQVPHTFTPNTPAKAAEVNANFDALLNEIQTLKTDLARTDAALTRAFTDINKLSTNVTDGSDAITALQAALASANAKIRTLESQSLADHVSIQTVDGHPTVWIEGANVQVVNGMNATNGIPGSRSFFKGPTNGLGNVIIGYNEASNLARPHCSDGRIALNREPNLTDQQECEAGLDASGNAVTDHLNNPITGVWAAAQRTGSHNLVIGSEHSYTSHGGLVIGHSNIINNRSANVTGGSDNLASGVASSVSGGAKNAAKGRNTSVSGGKGNSALGRFSSVSGGESNRSSGISSSVSGGTSNDAINNYQWIGGTATNTDAP